jgi:hypothetical protein
VKRTKLNASSGAALFISDPSSSSDSNYFRIFFNYDQLAIGSYSTAFRVSTAQYRDVSAWYHIVVAFDTTQATASDRVALYVNGSQITAFTTNNSPTLNADYGINGAFIHNVGLSGQFDGYLADIHFIDGQALTPSSFGYTDSNGIWQPKAYTGTYGTNGFHLDFADNSAATTAGIGKDVSGNGNDWTPNNLSVTAGAGNDSLVDSPTNGTQTDTGAGGEVVGNYSTLNATVPLKDDTLANGNLELTTDYATASNYPLHIGTVSTPAGYGKWYWEINIGSAPSYTMIGIVDASESFDGRDGAGGNQYKGCSVYVGSNGVGYTTGVSATYSGTPYSALSAATLVGVIFDADNGTLKLSYDGVEQAIIFTGISSAISFLPCIGGYGDNITYTFNFGQRPFAYTAPSGYKALCTANLTSTTITTSGSYTGNGVADGPFVYLNGVPTAMTVGGNAVTFGTHADKLSNGFKIRTTSTTYNQNALTYSYTITTTGDPFKRARAQSNP